MARTSKKKKKQKKRDKLLISNINKIVPFYKTYDSHNPLDPNSPHIRKRVYPHPNERFKKFGTWDKI